MYDSLISTEIVQDNLKTRNWSFFDCRFDLKDNEKKKSEFRISHLPKAIYVNLGSDLSNPSIPRKTGRHPLPEIDQLVKKFSLWGIDSSVQVVAYDDFDGAHAARFWWILKWLGHKKVAVIDGGWPRWLKEDRPVNNKIFEAKSRIFNAKPNSSLHLSAENVLECCKNERICILDARSEKRFTGENEPIDPVGGHIPSAISYPHTKNIDENGNWKSKSDLRKNFIKLFGDRTLEKAISYCGSGITACHNILAIYYAGLGFCRMYPGSWSDWINDPNRPVVFGKK